MTIEEIQTKLRALEAMMLGKGVVTPSAQLHVVSSGRHAFHASGDYGTSPFEGRNYFVEHDETVAGVLTKARDFIAAMPSPEEAVTREYLTKVSAAIDYATEHSIDDDYVAPLRGVTCAMTDNLLTAEDKS